MSIGIEQLENIQNAQVPFILLDLCEQTKRLAHQLLRNAIPVAAEQVAPLVKEREVPMGYPIVLVCETGTVSLAVAHELEKLEFMNIFVLDGGIGALT